MRRNVTNEKASAADPRWLWWFSKNSTLVMSGISCIAGLGRVHVLQTDSRVFVGGVRATRKAQNIGGGQIIAERLREPTNADSAIKILIVPKGVLSFLDCAVGLRNSIE
jgi:hypothetical protein